MRIEQDLKLDFKDVLIRPKRSTLTSRSEVDIARSYEFLHSKKKYHGIPIIAVVGNDAGWSQIARDQVEILGDDVGTALAPSDYHRVAEGFGAAGILLDDPELAEDALAEARAAAASGRPALVNALLGRSDFRKGSISV